jgi:hypothetical protein
MPRSGQWQEEHQEEMRAYRRKWYAANRERAKAQVNKRKEALKAWFAEYKATLTCVVCGENHIACLDFHHRNPSEKDVAVSVAVGQRGWSRKRILAEIAKCDVLCANCHRKLHWEEEIGGQ